MSITAEVSVATGLSSAQVEQRRREGLGNEVPHSSSRSVGEIIRANVLTRINAMLGVLLVLVLITGSWIDGMFGLLIVANSAIGIVQEVRAKRTLDRLAIVGQAKPVVRRDGEARSLAPREVVRDDVIELGPGDQIVVDGRVVSAELLEIDESLLTGEPDPIAKKPGDQVLSGSYVVSGSGACLATRVGPQAYAARLAAEASRFTLVDSQVRSGIDTILKVITYLLIPAGLLSIGNQLVASRQGWRPAVTGMVAALVPMVPEGLVLLTSIAFAVGVVRLGARRCLVQELPAIEGLARVDVVCADKTGTLTQHGMRLSELRVLAPEPGAETTIRQVLAAMAADDRRPNASVQALAEALGSGPGWKYTAVAPFSSEKKWSGFSYGEHDNWVLGAPDVLAAPETPVAQAAEELAEQGLRVLLLGRSDRSVADPAAPGRVRPAALVVLAQKIRSDARETLNYFASQDVALKVLSGDNAVSVGAVASSLGVPGGGHPVDARTLPEDRDELAELLEEQTTFGRVRPDQKRAMVGALQASGHTVAMTGDGVNDVLALKDADIGVAMGSGSSAARAVAQLVLLDNEFAILPYVVAEGRRVIGNIERVSNLFLTKTVYSVVLAFLVGVVGIVARLAGHEPIGYPFLPRHVTIVAWFTIGIPAFVLSLAPNHERARDGFVSRVLRLAIPSGVVIGVCAFAAYLLAYAGPHATDVQQRQSGTTALITVITIAMWVLAIVARPYTWWKIVLLVGSAGACLVLFMVPPAQRFFALDPSNLPLTGVGLAWGAMGIALVEVAWWVPRVSRRAGFPGPASNRPGTRW